MKAEEMTREQVSAYLISQSVTALAELMGMHWNNVADAKAGFAPRYTDHHFQRAIERNTISFQNVMSLFERQEVGRYGSQGPAMALSFAKWDFLERHWQARIEGLPLHIWIDANLVNHGGLNGCIEYAMKLADGLYQPPKG